MPWAVKKLKKLEILKIKDLKTANRDRKKSKQTRYEILYSIDSKSQDNIWLPLYNHLSYKSLF